MINRMICAVLASIMLLFMVSGCEKSEAAQTGVPVFTSYRDIPGVTEDETKAIESLKNEYDSFVYGMPLSIEAFTDENGDIKGFSALFCEWLTGIFGIRFVPAQYEWSDLLVGLEIGTVDFTGEMRATEERMKVYYMTAAIAERILKRYHLAGISVTEIAKTRPVKCALITGSAGTAIAYLDPDIYKVSYVDRIDQVHDKLISGEIDAFLHSNSVEANFFEYGDIAADVFFPMINSPVSLTAQKAKLKPVISIVQKALSAAGVRPYLNELYKEGYAEYLRYKLYLQLTDEERAYIQNNPVVKYAAETDRYPVSFYNAHSGEWQGVAADTVKELEHLTGLSFQIVNSNNVAWPDLLAMLEKGEASMISELIPTEERIGRFLWPDNTILRDFYSLLSKSDYPSLNINEVIHRKVGLLRNTAYGEMFKLWFPFHSDIAEYSGIDEAIGALDRGEIDLIMSSEGRLRYLTNYCERPDFKANIIFDTSFNSKFGFNKNEDVLCSIIDKALDQVNTEIITRSWMSRTFDYRSKLMEAQRPWLFGAVGLSLCVILLVLVLFLSKLREGKRLEKTVTERTSEIELKTAQLESQTVRLIAAEKEARSASETKNRFIANMSHEMRTPMNVIVGLTDLMMEESDLVKNVADNLKKISAAAHALLRLISDVLDISKIESGKFGLAPVPYDVPGLLNDIVTLNAVRKEGKPISFRLDISDDLPCTLYGDDVRVRQVLNNLLSNAFKYTSEGAVTLGLHCERGDGEDVWLSFYVSDTGIGIPPEDIEKLFSDHNQVDAQVNREIDGAGLGLGVTQKLVEQMDGNITAESEYGIGSTFRARVRQSFVSDKPVGPEMAEALRGFYYKNNRNTSLGKLTRPDLSYAKVLVVDDFPPNLDVAAGFLRKYKMRVDCVLTGQKALDLIKGGEPVYDAIFMDHMMPGMDGIEATRLIRAIDAEYARTVPVIALTANATAGNEEMFLANGFQAFLSKPLNVNKLDSVIQQWVRDKSKE